MSNPEAIRLRPERPGDEPFLFEVYAGTRAEELALTNWDEQTRQTFLTMQFQAMRRAYRDMYPAAEFSIIEMSGERAGRMVINRSAEEFRVVDIGLLPQHRNHGIGTFLIRQLCAEAAARRLAVRLMVLKNSPAVRWYERLGFSRIRGSEVYDEMEWRSATQPG